jgi:hypothetical protein
MRTGTVLRLPGHQPRRVGVTRLFAKKDGWPAAAVGDGR